MKIIDARNAGIFSGYVQGVYDALSHADNELLLGAPDSATVWQVCSVVEKYLKDHPEEWQLGGAVVVQNALRKALMKGTTDKP